MTKMTVRDVTLVAVVAALYVILTAVPPLNAISYGPIQFRLSEVLNFLPFYNRRYIWAVTLGCLISNIFTSSNIALDMTVGTLQTLVTLLLGVWLFKRLMNQRVANVTNWGFLGMSLFTAVMVGAIIGAELAIVAHLPFWLIAAEIFVGELAVMLVGSVVIFQLARRVDLTR
ncbi:MAG: QueT transporter family protein [Streptococcaceae bacterium]|nr:QueT transporter family protein [Streptococcaceae bacterium]